MSKNLLLGVVLFIVLGFVFLLVNQGLGGLGDEPRAATGEATTQPAEMELATLEEPEPAAQAALQQAGSASLPEHREEVSGDDLTGSCSIELRDEQDRPLGKALVWALASSDSASHETFADLQRIDAFMQAQATRYTTAEDGTLSLPRIAQGKLLLMAREGELWGRLKGAADQDSYRLVLRHDVHMRVQVVDQAHQPLPDVPVKIENSIGGWTETVVQEPTAGPQAIASFAHVQLLYGLAPLVPEVGTEANTDVQWRVTVDALTTNPIRQTLTPEDLPEGLITFVLPATGRVVVKVIDEWQQPFDDKGSAKLVLIPKGEAREASPFEKQKRRSIEAPVVNGTAVFPRIELGLELAVSVKRWPSTLGTRAYGSAPHRPGDTTTIEVQLGSDHSVLRFRVVDENGAPHIRTNLNCAVKLRSQFSLNENKHWRQSDELGYILMDFQRVSAQGMSRIMTVSLSDAGDPKPSGTINFSHDLELGLNEFGDLLLAKPQAFARGRVVNEAGQPLAGAKIILQSKAAEDYRWSDHKSLNAKSQANGSFEILGPVEGDSFQVAAELSGYACAWVELSPDAENVLITMPGQGQMAGRVLLDESIPSDMIRVRSNATTDVGEYLDYDMRVKQLDDSGGFSFGNLLPGLRGLTINANGQGNNLFSMDQLEVRSGETCADPRLREIDLRNQIFLHQLELFGREQGESFSGSILFDAAGSEVLQDRAWLQGSTIRILSRFERIDLHVSVSGYRAELLKDFSGKSELQLRRGPSVFLHLTGNAEVPAPPIFIKVALVPLDSNGGDVDFSGGAFDEGREIRVRVPSPGKMRAAWIVERRMSSMSMAGVETLEREQLFDIQDTDAPQHFDVSLTQEELQQLIGGQD